jgi:hypothetical protein
VNDDVAPACFFAGNIVWLGTVPEQGRADGSVALTRTAKGTQALVRP